MEIKELPQGLETSFDVIEQSGALGQKTWILQDTKTGEHYRVTPATVTGWDVVSRRQSIGPSIILSLDGVAMVALHLPTGEVYTTSTPPTGLRIKASLGH